MEDISSRFDNLRVPVSANEREKGTTPYYGANGIQDYVKGFTHNGEYVLIAEDGANDLKNYPVKYVNGLFWANNHVHVVQGKEGICDNKYLKYCFTKTNIESLLVGGGRAKLNANIMMSIDLTVPSFNEQVELGRLFYEIDNLITLHQRKFNDILVYRLSTKFLFLKLAKNVWEQRKLKELCNIYDGTHQTPNYKDSGIMFLSVENIKNLKSNKYISYDDFKRNFKVYPEKNDILMTRIGDIGTTNIVKENSLKAYYVSLALLKCKSINPYYLNFAMNSNFVQNGLKLRSLLTAIPMKINKDQIGETDIIYPVDFKEQSKIGKVFDNIDNLITLHHRKYTYIFYSWEQRKLADVGNIITGTTPSTSDESNYNGDYLFVSPADINTNRYIEKTNTTLSKKGFESGRILNEGSVLFVSIGSTIGKVAQTKEKSTTNQQINAIEVNGKNNNNFIYSLLEKHSNNIRAGASTQAVPILNKTSFSLLEFNMPKIIEQEKIGQLFRQIDNLITLHQHKELKRRNDNNEHLRW